MKLEALNITKKYAEGQLSRISLEKLKAAS